MASVVRRVRRTRWKNGHPPPMPQAWFNRDRFPEGKPLPDSSTWRKHRVGLGYQWL